MGEASPRAWREASSGAWAAFRRGWLAGVAVLVVTTAVVALATVLGVTVGSEAAWAQRDAVFADGMPTEHGIALLLLQVGLPAALVVALLAAGGYAALGHVAAALYHQFIRRDRLLARMWPQDS